MCIESCKKQMQEGMNKESFDAIIYDNVKMEKNWLLKICPLIFKDLVMRLAYNKVGDGLHTANLSNLGVVDLPDSVKEYVTDINFILGTSYSCQTHMAVVGYGDHVNVSFSREFVENKMEREFFRTLSGKGIEVEVSSNYWEAE